MRFAAGAKSGGSHAIVGADAPLCAILATKLPVAGGQGAVIWHLHGYWSDPRVGLWAAALAAWGRPGQEAGPAFRPAPLGCFIGA